MLTKIYLALAVFIRVDAQSYSTLKHNFLTPRFPQQMPKAPLSRPNLPFPRPKVHGRIPLYPRPDPMVQYPRHGPMMHGPQLGPCNRLERHGCYGPYGNGRRVLDREKWNYMTYSQDGSSILGTGAYQHSYPQQYINNQPSYPRPYPRRVWANNYQMNFIPQTYFNPWGSRRYSQGRYMMTRYGGVGRNFGVGRYFGGGRLFSRSRRYGGARYGSGNSEFERGNGYVSIGYGGAYDSSGRNFYPIFRGRRRGRGGRKGRGYYYIEHDDDDD